MAAPDHFEIASMVFHAYSNVVTWLQASCTQDIAELDGSLVELAVCGDNSGLGVDDGWAIRMGRGMKSWVHGYKTNE